MTLEQTTNPVSIPLTGLGYNPLTNLYGQQLGPQSPIGNILSQLGSLAPYAALNPQFAQQSPLSAILGGQFGPVPQFAGGQQLGHAQQFGQQFAQPNIFGGQLGYPSPIAAQQQLALQNLVSAIVSIVSQLAQLLPYASNPQLVPQQMGNPWGNVTPYQNANPYQQHQQQYGVGFRQPWQ